MRPHDFSIVTAGFKALGDSLQRIPPGQAFNFTTGAYANQLNNIGILGNFAFVPNTGASPNGPFRFDVNTQSLLHVIDRNTNQDAGQTLNMHLAVAAQTIPRGGSTRCRGRSRSSRRRIRVSW